MRGVYRPLIGGYRGYSTTLEGESQRIRGVMRALYAGGLEVGSRGLRGEVVGLHERRPLEERLIFSSLHPITTLR